MVFNLCKAAFLYTVVAMCYINASGHAIERGMGWDAYSSIDAGSG